MEGDDEQAGPDPDPEEEPRRCGRHPTQLLTGVCSSCLMERLSSVRDPPEPEIVELRPSSDDTGNKLRTTLMLLFQLDDSCAGAGPSPSGGDCPQPQQAAESGDRGGRRRSGSWLRSILPRPWRRSSSVKAPSPPPPPPRRNEAADPARASSSGGGPSSRCFGNGDSRGAERKPSFRRSSEWREPPRHSWDGAMVGKAFACSFACLEDPPDTTTKARRSSAEEMVAEIRGRGRGGGDAGLEMVGRRRSNRWSRVWDRSITSPLKEFVRKGEHVLERSLSESRREVRRGKNAEAADISGEVHHSGRTNGHVPGRASHTRSSIGDTQNFRADWLKNKECKIGRSRSVHYTSPGNLDNGMLRFYLTPMRSSRTANRGRRRNPRLFGRGLFGFI